MRISCTERERNVLRAALGTRVKVAERKVASCKRKGQHDGAALYQREIDTLMLMMSDLIGYRGVTLVAEEPRNAG